MKKTLLTIFSLAALFFADSCTPEDGGKVSVPEPLTFEITNTPEPNSVSVEVVPSAQDVPYYFDVLSEEDLNNAGGQMEKLPEYLIRSYWKGEFTEEDLLSGTQKKTFGDLQLNTTYYVVAIGIYDNALNGSSIETVTTLEWEKDEWKMHIRPTVLEVGLDYVDIDVAVDNESAYYLAMPYTMMEIPTQVRPEQEEAAKQWIWEKIQTDINGFCRKLGITFEQFLVNYEGQLSFRGSKTVSQNDLANNFGHGVYIVGVDKDFKKTSDLHRVTFTTKKAPVDDISFEVVSEINGRNVSLSVKPDDMSARYSMITMETEMWNRLINMESAEYQMQSRIANMYKMFAHTNSEMTHEDKVNALTHIGSYTYACEEKYADCDYAYILAKFVAGRSGLYISSLVDVGAYKTDKVAQSECEFNFEVTGIGTHSVDVSVSPSDRTVDYTYDVVPLGAWKDMEEGDILSQYISKNKHTLNAGKNIYTGDQSKTFKIVPDTEYAVIAFGYKDAGVSTALGMTTFTSEKSGDASACTFDIVIDDLQQQTVNYSVSPSSEIVYWQTGVVDADSYNAATIKESIEKSIANKVKWSSVLNYNSAMAVDDLSKIGSATGLKNKGSLVSGTKYIIWVAAVNTDGFCMEPVTKEVDTKMFTGGKATVEVIADKYYDASLADFIPGISHGTNEAVLPIQITASDNAAGVYWVFRINRNDENVPDEELLNQTRLLKASDGSAVKYKSFRYDQGFTVIIGVKDENGQFGPLFKKYMMFSKSGVSPIEELEELYNSNK